MDPRLIITEFLSGERTEFIGEGQHDVLIVAEQAICEGHNELADQLSTQLNSAELEIVHFRIAQLNNEAEEAQQCLANALEISRTKDTRDQLLEA